MLNGNQNIDDHVGELLSGYVDGELTQQQRQLVSLHCEDCKDCRELLSNLREIREKIGRARLSEVGEDKWRETMNDNSVKTTRQIGWLMFIAGLLAIAGIGVFGFLFSNEVSIGMKLVIFAVYGGLAILLISVLRQRLIERKTDKYKDVEI
jgi:predicted anti-sigma-YlaC factor YlaD